MSRTKTNRKIMGRAARRARQEKTNAWRTRWARIASMVAKGERWWHYAHEQDLTGTEREDIGNVLEEFLRNQWTGEVERDGTELSTMYHAGFYLSCAWMIFSGTEAYELADVLDKHRIRLHPDWWLTDGWGAWHDRYGVKCGDCGGFTYAQADGIDAKLADVAWPERCEGCHAGLPAQHHTDVFGGESAWWANCSCGWETENAAKAERYAKGAATKHVKSATKSADLVAV